MDLPGLPFQVEPMRMRDVPAVVALERSVFATPWPATAFVHEITQNPLSHYHVLRRTVPPGVFRIPGLLGYGGYWLTVDEAHVGTLAVHPDWRGKRLGELLFCAIVTEARSLGADTVTLEVRSSNRTARNLYAKYGLEVVSRRSRYYQDNGEDALIMTVTGVSANAYGGWLERAKRDLVAVLRETFETQG